MTGQRLVAGLAGARCASRLWVLGACAALAGCQACIQSHEAAVLKGGLGEDHVHDAVRIAAVMQGFLVAISLN